MLSEEVEEHEGTVTEGASVTETATTAAASARGDRGSSLVGFFNLSGSLQTFRFHVFGVSCLAGFWQLPDRDRSQDQAGFEKRSNMNGSQVQGANPKAIS